MDGISIPLGLLKDPIVKGLNTFLKELFLSTLKRSDLERRKRLISQLNFFRLFDGVEYCLFYPNVLERKYGTTPFAFVRNISSDIPEVTELLFEFSTVNGLRQFYHRLYSLGKTPIEITFPEMPLIDIQVRPAPQILHH